MLASHYAEPVARTLAAAAPLRSAPSETADEVGELSAGETFLLLEDSVGWAWGYAESDGRVGYLPSDALSAVS